MVTCEIKCCNYFKIFSVSHVTAALLTLRAVNRRELDVTLLAEPSSDEDDRDQTTKRKKGQRQKSSVAMRDSKIDVKPLSSASSLASTGRRTVSTNKPLSAVQTRKKQRSLYHCLIRSRPVWAPGL